MTERPTIARLEKQLKEGFDHIESRIDNLTSKSEKIDCDLNEMKNKIISNLIEQNKKMQQKIEALENTVYDQNKELRDLQLTTEATNQYGRRSNIEISGVTNDIDDDQLEDKMIEIFNKMEVNVTKSDIESCHRLPAKNNQTKKTIVRFVNRKNCQKLLENKKKTENINFEEIKLPPNSKIYISENLNRFYQRLGFECRQLKRNKLIYSYKYQNEAFFIKFDKTDEKHKKITHVDQIVEWFPGFYQNELLNYGNTES